MKILELNPTDYIFESFVDTFYISFEINEDDIKGIEDRYILVNLSSSKYSIPDGYYLLRNLKFSQGGGKYISFVIELANKNMFQLSEAEVRDIRITILLE